MSLKETGCFKFSMHYLVYAAEDVSMSTIAECSGPPSSMDELPYGVKVISNGVIEKPLGVKVIAYETKELPGVIPNGADPSPKGVKIHSRCVNGLTPSVEATTEAVIDSKAVIASETPIKYGFHTASATPTSPPTPTTPTITIKVAATTGSATSSDGKAKEEIPVRCA